MTTLRWVVFASVGAVPAAAAVLGASGCSPSNDAGGGGAAVEAGGVDAPSSDGPGRAGEGAASTVKLQWLVTPVSAPGLPVGDGGAEAETGAGDASAATDATTDGMANDAGDDAGDGAPPGIEGVQVCVYQNSAIPCVTTGANGEFILPGLPVRSDVAITVTKTGYLPGLLAISTASTDMDGRADPIFMFATDGGAPPIGVPVDWTNKGQVNIFALGQTPDAGNNFVGDPGAKLALSPSSGNGPFYLDTNSNFVLSATSFVDTLAWYYNLTPGTYTLTWADPNNDCEPISFPFGGWGYPVPTPKHSLQFPIVAGYITGIVGEICTPNSIVFPIDGGGG